ncbi:TetR/AcrR family transcriptional regulator [Microbacterium allomyrinae]|uniref:TetR/AcrR family transcriptional regulator n=1 Tax=Microbacterium allomyrinae TaxID=2830666 RepID=A0A9X1LXT7_9MICO|nr:TetR/AcrR family transcriptional regulator [Microbacterium allomyrinae]MCC2033708.1 TetR/AcrR family transcriptional regulator [Microbacterium allomyrinae]
MPSTASPRVSSLSRQNRGPAAAADNRRALIAAAREVYAEGGLGAPFSAVAKRAGVGQGSLYRHFPDRTALAVAVFEDNVRGLEDDTAPADRTIDDLLDLVVEQAVVSTAFIELITADLRDPRVAGLGARFHDLVARVVERDRDAGRIGGHVETEDVTMATGMLATELARSDPAQRPAVAARARALFRAAFAPR